MTRFSLWLVAATAALGLVSGLSAQDAPKSKFMPFEIQGGASWMWYGKHWATSEDGMLSSEFTPKNPRVTPSLRASLEVYCHSNFSFLVSAGYRFMNDVPLTAYKGYDTYSDLRHESQLSLGALVRYDFHKNFDAGIGIDVRNDWSKAHWRQNTDSENSIWRPWIRANARYLFDIGKNWTPFIGAEVAFALGDGDGVHAQNYYRDFALNTGDFPLGPINQSWGSPDSFVKGHAPMWEAAFIAGVRFGRSSCKAPKAAAVVPKPLTPVVEKVVPPPAPVVDDKVATPPPPPPPPTEEKAAPPPVVQTPAFIEIEGVRIHFVTNSSSEAQNRTIVRNWAAKYKNVVDANALLVTGHTDKTGSYAHNAELSKRRANALANYLRAEGINVPQANVIGRSWDEPIADNDTPEGLAKNRRAEVTVTGNKFRIKSYIESTLFGVR